MDYKFFDPETGDLLYQVPHGATIPEGEPYGWITSEGNYIWDLEGMSAPCVNNDKVPRFTRSPLKHPTLPSDLGSIVIAHTENDTTRRPFMLCGDSEEGLWFGPLDDDFNDDGSRLIDPKPMRLIARDTYERLVVLDPMDKRDRIDSAGDRRSIEKHRGTSREVGRR